MLPEQESLCDDRNVSLSKFLIRTRLASESLVNIALAIVTDANDGLEPNTPARSLLEEVARVGKISVETLMEGIVDQSGFPYIPLENYDVDRHIVRVLPKGLCFSRLVVPFDVLSHTILIATANPFEALGARTIEKLLDYNLQWYLAAPAAIVNVLCDTHRIPRPVHGMGSEIPHVRLPRAGN